MRTALLFLFLAVLPVRAAIQCTLAATPALVRAEGLAERLGDIILDCGGAAPGQEFRGVLSVALSAPFTNRSTDGALDAILSISDRGPWAPLSVKAQLVSPTLLSFNGIAVNFNLLGRLSLRIENLRAPGRAPVQAAISSSGNVSLPVPIPFVTVSQPYTALLASNTGAIAGISGDLPPQLDLMSLVALRIPFATTRLTENGATAFEARSPGAGSGTRIRIRYTNVPAAGRVLVPEFIAGSSAVRPTSAGDYGLPASPGLYQDTPPGTLLLTRVRGADENGAGGTTAPFLNAFGALADADRWAGVHQVVYEVMDSSTSLAETAQVPAFLHLPLGTPTGGIVRQSVSLAPVSNIAASSETAPIPRFLALEPPLDCVALNDCQARWFPRFAAFTDGSLNFRSPQNTGPQTGNIRLFNQGGGLMEWTARISYLDGDGWLRLTPSSGIGQSVIQVDALPGSRPLGRYRAEITLSGAPPLESLTLPVAMEVVPPLPPPAPRVTALVNAADGFPGPLAPGSLARLSGENLTGELQVFFGNTAALIVLRTASDLLIQLPTGLPNGPLDVVLHRGGSPGPPFRTEIREVAPYVFAVLNQDNRPNNAATVATTGTVLQVFATGIPALSRPWVARIHDIWIPEPDFAAPLTQYPGMIQINARIPVDLPTMPTEIQICGTPQGTTAPVCSRGIPIWIERAPSTP